MTRAETAENRALAVSLLNTMIGKAKSKEDKVGYLRKKYFHLEGLRMRKLSE